MSLRNIIVKYRKCFVALFSAAFVLAASAITHADEVITIYKQAYCGCCEDWTDYIRQAGFEVNVVSVNDIALINELFGIPQNVAACHTAKLADYYIVGHVPAPDILKLLEEKPDVMGLSVPGMPVGSPGMEIRGMAAAKYNSVLFTSDRTTNVYVSH